MSLALEHVKVVDVTQWLVGSASAGILAEWGADVVKIEHPVAGDPLRGLLSSMFPPGATGSLWGLVNRNKRSMTVDWSRQPGRDIIYRLVRDADVFVSNLRPGSLERARLDFESLRRINARIVYAHGNAYGQRGAESEKRGFDETAFWARAGFMDVLGEKDALPVSLNGAIGDLTTSMVLVAGIMSALYIRERTGEGQRVDTSLLGCGVWAMGWQVQINLATGQSSFRETRFERPNPLFNTYLAKDNRWFQLAMPQSDRYWPALCRAIGREDLQTDGRFLSYEKRSEHRRSLIALLDQCFATLTLDSWMPVFDRYGLVYGRAATIPEVSSDAQVWANDYIREVDDPRHGTTPLVDCPIRLSGSSAHLRDLGPELGEHTEEILLELGYSWDDIVALKEQQIIG